MTLATEFGIAGGLLLGLVGALEVGYRLGRGAAKGRASGAGDGAGQIGAVQGAVLGLLGLLLGFSFAGAASRFIERQDLIIQEANAIGTAYLRADMLAAPHAGRMQETLAAYVRHRLEVSRLLSARAPVGPEALARAAEFHTQLWGAARDGVLDRPQMAEVVLEPVNEVIDLHSTRVAAGRRHLPALVLGLLVGCSLLGVAVIGYGCGLSGRRSLPITAPLALLVAAALWTTIDLDYPRAGFIRLSDAPLEQLNLGSSP